jgi:hypothetical protein
MNKYLISLLAIIIIIVFIASIYYYFFNFTESQNQQKSVIEGSLGYPSEIIPDDVEVCAINTKTEQKFCTRERLQDEKYIYNVGYKIEVEPGTYNVFATRDISEDFKATVRGVLVQKGQNQTYINLVEWHMYGSKNDLIEVDSPSFYRIINSPLVVTGKAKGSWFFEATFLVKLLDTEGNVLAQTTAEAQGEWMTEAYVPFKATIEFENPKTSEGELVLEKANPSGLPENDEELIIPVRFR